MKLSRRGILGGGALAALAAPFAGMKAAALAKPNFPPPMPGYNMVTAPTNLGKAAQAIISDLQRQQSYIWDSSRTVPHMRYGVSVDADLAVLPVVSLGWLLAKQRERDKRRRGLAEQLQRRIDAIFENPFNVVGS